MLKLITPLLVSVFCTTLFAQTAPSVREGYFVFDGDKVLLKKFASRPELTIDQVSSQGYEVYGPLGTKKYVSTLTGSYVSLNESSHQLKSDKGYNDIYKDYPTNEDDLKTYQQLAEAYPQLVSLFSIGKTSTGLDIWAIKISDNVQEDEVEPEFAYIANMHGNEVVGRRLMVRLMQEMLESYTHGESEFESLINNNELFFIPTLNPDGYQKHQRGNAKWTDLNRNFPDFTDSSDNQNVPGNRAEETVAMMNFQAQHHISLSGSFHDGAVVVNYPWDTTQKRPPFHQMIIDLSKLYADQNEDMRTSHEFSGGITNGHDWYQVRGGMQDWAFYYHDNLMITFELSDIKWPRFSELEHQYQINRDSMISYMSKVGQGLGIHLAQAGLSGRVQLTETTTGKDLGSYPFFGSEWYKILPAGKYLLNVKASNGQEWTTEGEVTENQVDGSFISLE